MEQTVEVEEEKLFTNQKLLRLLWPLIIEQALSVLVGMADTVMVSSVGEAAISGVSLVDMINNLIFNIFAALATGGAVVTSQFLAPAVGTRPAAAPVSWSPSAPCWAWLSWLSVLPFPMGCCGCSSARSTTML